MNVKTIGEICAGIGVVFTVIWLALGVKGLRTLGSIRDALHRENTKP